MTNILNSKSYWTKCSSTLCGIAFVCYSIAADTSKNNPYWSPKVVSFPFEKTWAGLKFVGTHLDIVNHPTWFGVAALITIIGLYTLGKRIFEQPKVLHPSSTTHTPSQVDTAKLT